MDYVRLGRSGLEVSRVCVGGMSFGAPSAAGHRWTIGPEETEAVIRRAFDQGVNYIDTANCYAGGTSEELIGRALRRAGIPRDEVVLQSKAYFNEGGLSREAVNREIDGTLKRLGTDYLDVYLMHRFDYDTPIEETLEALDGLVRAGKVRAIGASAMYAYQLHNLQVAAERCGWEPLSVMQNHYNLLYREDERELIPVCRQFGMAIAPYSALASGHLARPTWDAPSLRSQTDQVMAEKYDRARAIDQPIVDRVAAIARERGASMAQVAIAWHLARGVESPVLGLSRPERVDEAVGAVRLALSEDEVVRLEEPYVAHDLAGVMARPGERPIPGAGKKVDAGRRKEKDRG